MRTGSFDRVQAQNHKSRDKIPVRIFVCETNVVVVPTAGDTVIIKINLPGETESLALLTTTTITTAGGLSYFSGTLNLNTPEIVAIMEAFQEAPISIEFELRGPGNPPAYCYSSVEPVKGTLYRANITGNEGVPTEAEPPYPAASTLALKSDIEDLQDQIDALETVTQEELDAALALKADLVGGLVPAVQLPSYVDDVLEFASELFFPEVGETQKIYVSLDTNKVYRWGGSIYIELVASPGSTDAVPEGAVNLYFTETRVLEAMLFHTFAINPHNTDPESIGLGNVDNTSDLNKAISTATQAALDTKVTGPLPCELVIACSDETTPLEAGAGKVTFRMPYAMTLTAVRASLTTAQASGSILTVDINEAGVSVLSTKLTVDNTEKTSTTAAAPAVISDAALADDAEITIDLDQIGNGTATGLKVTLKGTRV